MSGKPILVFGRYAEPAVLYKYLTAERAVKSLPDNGNGALKAFLNGLDRRKGVQKSLCSRSATAYGSEVL